MSQTEFSARPRDFDNIELPLKRFPCHLCRFSTEKKNDLKRHLMKHAGIKPFKCDQCEYGTTRRSDLAIHLKSHSGEKPFRCNFCPYSTARKNNFREHLMVHSKVKRLQCQFCNYSTNRKREFEHHEKIHLGIRPTNCNDCPYTAVKKSALTRHQKIHSSSNDNNNMIEIDEDGAENLIVSIDADLIGTMGTESSVAPHGKTEPTVKSNQSQHAGTAHVFPANFTNASLFPQQIGTTVTGTGSVLPQQVGTARFLSQHLATDAKGSIFSQYVKMESSPAPGNLPFNLGGHVVPNASPKAPFTTDNSKRFQCAECPYSSLKKHDLKRHALKHSGVKPFSCAYCPYRAFRKSDLTVHERTHEGEKNYKGSGGGGGDKPCQCMCGHDTHKCTVTEQAKCACAKNDVRPDKASTEGHAKVIEILEIPCYPKTATSLKSENSHFSHYSDELWKKRFLSNGPAFPSMSYNNHLIGSDTNLGKLTFVNHNLTHPTNKR